MVNKMSGFLVALFFWGAVSGDDDLSTKCSAEFPKVTTCLAFATAKATTPTKECCSSVSDLRNTDPGCLCFVIQQVHNGTNAAIKNMGIQEARLLQLPSACKVVNSSVAECPRLLHLPPNSPDAAIFTNNSTASTTTPVATPGTSSSSTANSGIWRQPRTEVSAIVAIVMFFFAFSSM